jgi:predicted metal-dependent enzyme (double-stranded beta helix superfamily)
MTLPVEDLHALARAFAEDEEAWREHVRHDAGRRTFHKLLDGDEATVWLICWMPGHDTGLHDHDGSSGAVRVVAGAVHEQRLDADGPVSRLVGAGEAFDFGPDVIHGVRHAGSAPTVTVHAYSPPLRGMGAYRVDPEGALRRELLAEDVELRPAG